MAKTEKVLIVGGGFAGVKTALTLAKKNQFSVTLLSDDTDLRYYPALYKTATGAPTANSSISLKNIFKDKAVDVVSGEAIGLDRQQKTVLTKDGQTYPYDHLILALGVVTNYFGIKGLAEFSFSIKSQAEANRFKRHLHQQLIDSKKPDLNYVIVGAGPTGIELAGALPGYLKAIMHRHNLPPKPIHIDLIEAMPRLLPNLPKATSRVVKRRLKRLGIKLYLGKSVEGETIDELTVNGKPIRSHSVIWTAGVTNHPFFKNNNFVLMGRGKVAVNAYLQAEPDIYILGDNANTPYSGMAQTALSDGEFVAKNLIRQAKAKSLKSYRVKKPVTVIPVGPRWAAVIWGKLEFHGLIGYLLRSLADLKGLHDIEDWPDTLDQFYKGYVLTDDCSLCTLKNS